MREGFESMKHPIMTAAVGTVLGNIIYAHRKGLIKALNAGVAGALKSAIPSPKDADEDFDKFLDELLKAKQEMDAEKEKSDVCDRATKVDPGERVTNFHPFPSEGDQ